MVSLKCAHDYAQRDYNGEKAACHKYRTYIIYLQCARDYAQKTTCHEHHTCMASLQYTRDYAQRDYNGEKTATNITILWFLSMQCAPNYAQRLPQREKNMLQTSQFNGFSPVYTRLCTERLEW